MLQEHRCRPAPGGLPPNWRERRLCKMATFRILQEHRTDRHRAGCLQVAESGALARWRLPGCSRNAGPTGIERAASKLARAAPLQDGAFQDAPGTQARTTPGGLPPNWREWRPCMTATSRDAAGTMYTLVAPLCHSTGKAGLTRTTCTGAVAALFVLLTLKILRVLESLCSTAQAGSA